MTSIMLHRDCGFKAMMKINKALEKEMFEDVMAEHAKKTVTLEKHTNLGGAKQATIHP